MNATQWLMTGGGFSLLGGFVWKIVDLVAGSPGRKADIAAKMTQLAGEVVDDHTATLLEKRTLAAAARALVHASDAIDRSKPLTAQPSITVAFNAALDLVRSVT